MDIQPLLVLARQKIATGELPDRALVSTVGGSSAGNICGLCGDPIAQDSPEIEVATADHRTVKLHPQCNLAWMSARGSTGN